RLRIGCSTTELRWRHHTCPGADSNRDAFRHHPLKMACLPISPPGHFSGCGSSESTQNSEEACRASAAYPSDCRFPTPDSQLTGLTGLAPATSGVPDGHSKQAELQPPK